MTLNLYGADRLEKDMVKAGYVRSPNNIHGLPSVHWQTDDPAHNASPVWYAGGAGLPCPDDGYEVQVCSDRIRIFSQRLFGEGKASFWDLTTIAVFTSVADFLAWCKVNGKISEPGLPAFSNSWD